VQKIPTRVRGTNFCTSSARFAPSFVRQPNDPECIQIEQNTPKHSFTVQWGGSDAFVAKNSDKTSWLKLLHYIGPFCTQIVRNTPKRQFRVPWGGSGAFVVKNSDATSWHKLLHLFGPFCTEFRKATKRSRMLPNSTKRTKMSV